MTDDERPAAPAVNGDIPSMDSVRIDKWLWAARCFKTRGLASEACGGGHVKVNGTSVKSAKLVRRGDEISVRTGEELRVLAVAGLWLQARLQPATAADEFTRWALLGGAAGLAATTLGALRDELIARGGAHASSLARGRAVRMALNQTLSDESATLADGAEVAFFPPVTGG